MKRSARFVDVVGHINLERSLHAACESRALVIVGAGDDALVRPLRMQNFFCLFPDGRDNSPITVTRRGRMGRHSLDLCGAGCPL